MSGAGAIINFLRSRVGGLGISSLILAALEKMMDVNFVCPCRPGLNELIGVCYGAVPCIGCFLFTCRFVDLGPGDGETQNGSLCKKIRFSALVALIWLFFFFIDGRYSACVFSHWGGQYTDTGTMKWCKPTGNETLMFESQLETQKFITTSQVSPDL